MYHIGRRKPEITSVQMIRDTRTYRHHARQAIVNAAVGMEADYLLMLDDDQTFTPQAFDILWEHRDRRVVSGLYFTRGIPPVPCMFNMGGPEGSIPVLEYPEDALFEVQIVGFGFILFDVNVFKRIPAPHFQIGNWLGEDVAFGAKAQAAGISLLVHTGCKVGHLISQRRVITEKTYEKYYDEVKKNEKNRVGSARWTGGGRTPKGVPEQRLISRRAVNERISEALVRAGGNGEPPQEEASGQEGS
jgi:hypothetical protein